VFQDWKQYFVKMYFLDSLCRISCSSVRLTACNGLKIVNRIFIKFDAGDVKLRLLGISRVDATSTRMPKFYIERQPRKVKNKNLILRGFSKTSLHIPVVGKIGK
jgi:hypothetical protein